MRFRGTFAPALLALCLGSAAVTTLISPNTVLAADESADTKKVLVGKLKGPKPQSAREWLVEGLEGNDRVTVVGGNDATDISQGASEDEIASFAEKHGADAVILGTTALQGKKGWAATLYVHNGKDGALIEEIPVEGGLWNNYRKAMRDPEMLMAAVSQAQLAEPEPEVDLDGEPEEEAEVASEPVASGDTETPSEAQEALELRAGLRMYSRSFRYTGTLAEIFPDQGEPELLTYNLATAPQALVHGTWFPLAHRMDGWMANIGLTGGYEVGFATSVAFGDEELDQSTSMWWVGPKIRFPFGLHSLGLLAAIGNHQFTIKGDDDVGPLGPLFPDVSYSFIDIGADARLRFDSGLLIGAHARYRIVNDTGDLQSDAWFPETSAVGFEYGGEVGWMLSENFDLLFGIDGLQYGMNFNPIAESTPHDRVAGGATDRYVSVWAGLAFRLPGSEGKGDGDGDVSGSGSLSLSADSDDD